MLLETAKLSVGKVRAARRRVVVLQHKPYRVPQLWQHAVTSAVTNTTTNPPPLLVPASALSTLVVNVQHGVLLHIVHWRVAPQINDNSLSPRNKR